MPLEEHAFVQRPIEDVVEPFGTFVSLGDNKTVTLPPTPYFGVCRLSTRRKRVIPRAWLAEMRRAKVHQPSYAVTSCGTLWQLDAETQLPYTSGHYSSEFEAVDGGRFAFKKSGRQTVGIGRAILLANRVSYSYFHQVFEQLTKLTIVDGFPEYRGWPVILDYRLPRTMWDMLEVVISKSREIIKLPPQVDIVIERLVIGSTQAFLPDDPALDLPAAVVNTDAACIVMNRLPPCRQHAPSKNFFWITRREYTKSAMAHSHAVRDIHNSEEISELFSSLGADVVAPETLSFDEQRTLFAQADVIGMAAGSAVTNILFCRPGTKVLILSQDKHVNPGLFIQIAHSLKLDLCWIFGPGVASSATPAHRAFLIDPLNIVRALHFLQTDGGIADGFIPFEDE